MFVVLQKYSLTKAFPSCRTCNLGLHSVIAILKQVQVKIADFYNGANVGSAAAVKEKPGNPHSFQSQQLYMHDTPGLN